jgi:hypothetical protein
MIPPRMGYAILCTDAFPAERAGAAAAVSAVLWAVGFAVLNGIYSPGIVK